MKNCKVAVKNKLLYLVTVIVCFSLIFINNINIFTGFVNSKIEIIKENEMRFMYNGSNTLGDTYSKNSNGSNSVYQNTESIKENDLLIRGYNNFQDYLLLQKNSSSADADKDMFFNNSEVSKVLDKLKKQVEDDSYRHKYFGLYYIFDFNYTFNTLKQLDPIIEKTSKAQKMPKAFLSAVLLREMMFIGQEDLLDGVPVIGGSTIGICQIGVKNIRLNEKIVHNKGSVIANKSDDEITEMLRNPEQAVYFCATQLRARAIQLAGVNTDLNKFDEKHMKQVLAAYNQSEIPFNLGPVMTKEKYAEQTYKYYELLSGYYGSEQAK
jgi:hypothetical protein